MGSIIVLLVLVFGWVLDLLFFVCLEWLTTRFGAWLGRVTG